MKKVTNRAIPAVIGTSMVDLCNISYSKRYQPLHGSTANNPPETLARFGVGINSKIKQLAFIPAIEPDSQLEHLTQLNSALTNAGLLDKFFILPDSTIIMPELVASAEYGEVANGCVIRLYSAASKTPLITCLLSSEKECMSVLHSLAERLNTNK